MREIKFRAWTSVSNKMYYSDNEDGLQGFFQSFYLLASKYRVLMQYTGLKDKNGKEIYEGDITRLDRLNNEEMQGVVEYSDNLVAFIVRVSGYRTLEPFPVLLVEMGTRAVEVIGNIWENPKLLEVNK